VLGVRPSDDVAGLPIAAAAAGNHDFDDGVDAPLAAARTLAFPLLCANVDVGLPATTIVDPNRRPVRIRARTRTVEFRAGSASCTRTPSTRLPAA
jgi:hypothetical protein